MILKNGKWCIIYDMGTTIMIYDISDYDTHLMVYDYDRTYIKITRWKEKVENKSINFNRWDFAGHHQVDGRLHWYSCTFITLHILHCIHGYDWYDGHDGTFVVRSYWVHAPHTSRPKCHETREITVPTPGGLSAMSPSRSPHQVA